MKDYSLTKSKYILGLQCEKALYMDSYHRERAYYSPETLALFKRGRLFESQVKETFAPAVDISSMRGMSFGKYPAITSELLSLPTTHALYEAGFLYDRVLVLADVVVRHTDGSLDVYEIKNSLQPTETFRHDIAIQYYVIAHSGHVINSFHLIHNDGNDQPVLVDMTAVAQEEQAAVAFHLAHFKEVLNGLEPVVEPGAHCHTPYACAFLRYCHATSTLAPKDSL